MSDKAVTGPPIGDDEISRAREIIGTAFAMPEDEAKVWNSRMKMEDVRVLRERGEVAGVALILPMGQWFGGRPVPMAGIGAVGVAPHHRSKGAALGLMKALLEELRSDGWALSALYPATRHLYRRVGYELAGSRFRICLQLKNVDISDGGLEVRPIQPEDEATIEQVYREHARRTSGALDRTPDRWLRARQPQGETASGYLFHRGDKVEGYVYFTQKRLKDSGFYTIHLSDLVALTPDAGRSVLSFLCSHRSLAEEAIWHGGPGGPLLTLLPEQSYTMSLHLDWMLRIVDVERALEARGYPAGVEAEAHFDVTDDTLPENNGRYVLRVSDGRGTVDEGGDGKLKIGVRGLASLYSGYLTPTELIAAGLLEADVDDAASAAALFAGPTPWLLDIF